MHLRDRDQALLPFERACGEEVVIDQVRTCSDSLAVDYSVIVPPECACSDSVQPMRHLMRLPNDSRPVHAIRRLVDPGGCYPPNLPAP
jgi:hypothetical protein